ncbi:19 kDa protein [Tomelloso virus]|uniref:19 kDa protein n=1 Tax=Tomelloso virus TaxID=2053981 RepID=A0A2H4T2R3_9VIRU|nr:19 kDa protein [Tomelloso virus]ATY70221.1 19 kDa protein [Tomelloso virus]
MDIWGLIITAAVIIISIVCLYYMYVFKNKASVNAIIDEAAQQSAFTPTIFKIYDKSTSTVCNRLIVVSPFDWYIWACRGELYIINPEGGIKCAANTTPAIQVLADQFLETCLKLNVNSILDSYVNGQVPYIAHYSIETTTFTILSALNLLMKEYITFDTTTSTDTTTKALNNNRSLLNRMRHLTESELKIPTQSATGVENFPAPTDFRVLSSDDVVKITTPRSPQNILNHYQKHTEKMKPHIEDFKTSYNLHELDPSHGSYITIRQHALDAHEKPARQVVTKPTIVE